MFSCLTGIPPFLQKKNSSWGGETESKSCWNCINCNFTGKFVLVTSNSHVRMRDLLKTRHGKFLRRKGRLEKRRSMGDGSLSCLLFSHFSSSSQERCSRCKKAEVVAPLSSFEACQRSGSVHKEEKGRHYSKAVCCGRLQIHCNAINWFLLCT